MERVSTGIDKLDGHIGGGYPKNRGILITGTPGSGKTILVLHAINQACIDKKKCVIIATEETSEDIIDQAEMFGFDFNSYVDDGLLDISNVLEIRTNDVVRASEFAKGLSLNEIDMIGLVQMISEDADLVVIDNIGVYSIGLSSREFRDRFDTLNLLLNRQNFTTLYIMDEAAYELTNKIADYSTYGCIKLMVKENPYTEKFERFIHISKMRRTALTLDMTTFDITSEGIKIQRAKSKEIEDIGI
ncbi:MAG: RAD55 family ATPase [Methanosarcinaceae archaeon]|nr:RAD55 family ATPase [Methanosarcinaceae archaeon]